MNVVYDFAGKTVLIVGGTTGIGRATALAFATAGADLVVAGLGAAEGRSLCEGILALGRGQVEFVEVDVRLEACRRPSRFFGSETVFGGITISVFIIGGVLLTKTAFGESVFADGGDFDATRTAGINVSRVTFLVYVIAAICGGMHRSSPLGVLGRRRRLGAWASSFELLPRSLSGSPTCLVAKAACGEL